MGTRTGSGNDMEAKSKRGIKTKKSDEITKKEIGCRLGMNKNCRSQSNKFIYNPPLCGWRHAIKMLDHCIFC